MSTAKDHELRALVIDASLKGKGSRWLELFSPDGLSHALVGASRLTGLDRYKWSEHIQPLQLVQLVLQKKGSWMLVQEGLVEQRFEGLRENYEAFCAAQSMRLSIKKISKPGLAAPALYESLIAHLQALHHQFPASKVLASFLAKTLWVEGYIDQEALPSCACCNASQVALWNDSGAWACAKHKVKGEPWSLLQQQALLELLHNKSLSKLQQPEETGLAQLLKKWIAQL